MLTVLVIEDDDTMRQGISQVLKRLGYRVYEASGGPKGIEQFKRFHHDLVITDYRMSPINGLDVLKEIKDLDATEITELIAYISTEVGVVVENEKFVEQVVLALQAVKSIYEFVKVL